MTFSELNLNPALLKAVAKCGYETPTPIQHKAIPPVLGGRDVMGLAQTGTGKTAAFLLPILQRLMEGPRGRVRALVVAPTRELAEQTHDAVGSLGGNSRLKSVAIYGGVGMNPQVQKVRQGAEIVVACPGRLLDHIGRGTINLSNVEVRPMMEGRTMTLLVSPKPAVMQKVSQMKAAAEKARQLALKEGRVLPPEELEEEPDLWDDDDDDDDDDEDAEGS